MDIPTFGDGDILSAISNMNDDQLRQLLQASNVPNRSAIVQQQLAEAQQLQQPGQQHSSPLGALFGGVSDMLRSGRGFKQQQAAQGQQEQLMKLLEDPSAMRNINGAVGMPNPMQQQQTLANLLRSSGGAGDLSMLAGLV